MGSRTASKPTIQVKEAYSNQKNDFSVDRSSCSVNREKFVSSFLEKAGQQFGHNNTDESMMMGLSKELIQVKVEKKHENYESPYEEELKKQIGEGIQERKRLYRQPLPNMKKVYIKNMLKQFQEQIKLDEDLRNGKLWLSEQFDDEKWIKVQKQL